MIAQALGGIGLFLVGMVIVTDQLRAAAGDGLRRFLLRFTGGPIKSLASGAAVTALVQSSSATTVATIGFVGAGLLTFEQALGLILGANLGTTATGWIVALLGLKFSVSTVALPMVGVGALIKLFSRGRVAHLGLALAGFGIIFVGIDVLQEGMAAVSEKLDPSELPRDTWGGRVLLVGVGAVMTTVMQSSSAAVATTLTALHGGAISLEQAAAMVIGINVGTTVTAGLAAIGASTAAKRTAFAHLLFNALTGSVAFATLPAFVWVVSYLGDRVAAGNATIMLAAFHTAFNFVGVLLILPFTRRFARLVVRVIHHRGPELTRMLDPEVARQGTLATEAVRQTSIEIGTVIFGTVGPAVERRALTAEESESLDLAASALRETVDYVASLRFTAPMPEGGHRRYVSTIHTLDHLGRLVDLLLQDHSGARDGDGGLDHLDDPLLAGLAQLEAWAMDPRRSAPVERLRHVHETIVESRRGLRANLLERAAAGELEAASVGVDLDRLRWLEELAYHLWRVAEHLRGERLVSVAARGRGHPQHVSYPPEPNDES